MCGIAGIWQFNNNQLGIDKLKRFTDAMRHRGPDGADYKIFDNANLGLGHRRLSILDLSEAGKQPMSYADGRYWITYNGEVFNFLELKSELMSLGFKFMTSTDTEIILAAYQMWGSDCQLRFNGMWAFAIWDQKEKSLFLSRDRFGIKPLYYLNTKDIFAFASETYAFKYLEGYNRRINPNTFKTNISNYEALEGYGYSIFEDIYQVLPGHSIEYKLGSEIKQKQWWNTNKNKVSVSSSYDEQKEEFFTLFKDALKLRLRSDVPIATALSGGLDSSAVYCMINDFAKSSESISRLPNDWQQAYVAVFPNEPIDERKYAEYVVKHTGANANFINVDYSNISDHIVKSTQLFDSISDNPIYPVSNIYSAMYQNGIRVSMDGHGVDEMMYGYRKLIRSVIFDSYHSGNLELYKNSLDTFLNMVFESDRDKYHQDILMKLKVSHTKKDSLAAIKAKIKNMMGKSYLPLVAGRSFLRDYNANPLKFMSESRPMLHEGIDSENYLYNVFHFQTLPAILRNFDRASMQSSIEIRMPFMDHRLVSYVFSLPKNSLIGDGFTKRILRQSLKSILPEEIYNRKLKLGFPVPLLSWVKQDCKDLFRDILASEAFLKSEFWDGPQIKNWADTNYEKDLWSEDNIYDLWVFVNAYLIQE